LYSLGFTFPKYTCSAEKYGKEMQETYEKLSSIEDQGETDRVTTNTRWTPPLPLASAAPCRMPGRS